MTATLPSVQVECPSCASTFDVDPARVPTEGIAAICSHCLRTFLVQVPADALVGSMESVGASAELSSEPAGSVAAPAESVAEPAETVAEPAETVAEPAEPVVEAAPPPKKEFLATPPRKEPFEDLSSFVSDRTVADDAGKAGSESAEPDLSLSAARFARRDPSERAKRLARVLVSDMIAYHPERYKESLEAGTLKEDFEEEIARSWKDYVDQVGNEMAESTPYFTEALNEVLAKGDQVF